MENQQQEWVEAQKIVISTDLVAATKKHLRFLEVVDNNGQLYDGPVLEKAIFRYKYCWLPLLAKHIESEKPQIQLVVPLDCEWIWHCHRLNPVRYMADCLELFGKMLDPGCVVVSSIEKVCKKQTEGIWQKEYPEEPYELNVGDHIASDPLSKLDVTPSTEYDLTSAVMRQSSFYHKVTGPMFRDDRYLEEAVRRYKGFLYLVKKNMEMKSMKACVPTYDIDLMWHSHQLHPVSYCKDVFALVGQVLHHDDTDTDQSKGGKLDVGIKTTTKHWGEMFGSLYWRVGSRQATKELKGENLNAVTARCWCITEDTKEENLNAKTARCWCITEDTKEENLNAMTARCWCITEDMKEENLNAITARCWCITEDTKEEKLIVVNAKCSNISEDMNGEKSSEMTSKCMAARCKCTSEGTRADVLSGMTARCKCGMDMEGEKSHGMTERCITSTILRA